MILARTLSASEAALKARHRHAGLTLAESLPRLMVAARRIAATVAHGLHGRRRAGMGENFWQFRHFSSGEAANRIDWRRSARDEHLYVREREWEAAHTVWIWLDRSASMAYGSSLASDSKLERAVVLALALADVLVQGGERVGLLGLTRPTASRRALDILAEALAAAPTITEGAPILPPVKARSEVVLIGDFLEPEEELSARLRALAGQGARGHLIAVSDPVEEIFPFTGRTELIEPETGLRLTTGRAQDLRADYTRRLEAHRAMVRQTAARMGWSCLLHRTDQPPSQVLLALHARLAERTP